MWHQESLIIITDIFEESFESDDIFTDNLLLGFFNIFVAGKIDPVIIPNLEIVLVIIDFYPVSDNFIEISLKGDDDSANFLLIVRIDIQNIFDIERYKQ